MSIEIEVQEHDLTPRGRVSRWKRLEAATYDPGVIELLQSFAGDPITKIVIYTKPAPVADKLKRKL